ncbi:MAG: NTP transferase domain-containing protein [Eubacterium sp.]|nr:NTP transferase domain-containing protein [Candidatus Colimonas fimequi]
MSLTREQFDILVAYATEDIVNAGSLLEYTPYDTDTIIRVLDELSELKYISNSYITRAGFDALEPYRARRAVLMAAGFGSRLQPVSLKTPKPLVDVNGTRIIDTLISALYAAGIDEIYVVRGYLAEKFDMLTDKYPNINFVHNPIYDKANNISSVMYASDLLENAYLLEADLMLSNPKIIKKYNYCSNFLGIKADSTDDWCFIVNDDNVIDEWKKGGEGAGCYQEVGISYWTEADGAQLRTHVRDSFNAPNGDEQCWEFPMLIEYRDQYHIEVRECTQDDVVEIDSYEELIQIDDSYLDF